MTDVASLPAALTALVGRLRDGDWNMRTPEDLAEAVADAIMEALAPRSPAPSAGVEAVEAALTEYVRDYEFLGEDGHGREGYYTPSERERTLIEDAIRGWESERPTLQHPAAPTNDGPFGAFYTCGTCHGTGVVVQSAAPSVSPAVAGDGLPPICTCGHCLCPTHDTPLASSAPQGEAATWAGGVQACIAWVERRRHAFEEEYGSIDPSTNAMEFGIVEREEYDCELVEIEEGLRGLLTTPPPAPAAEQQWLDIPPFLRRDATMEERAAWDAKGDAEQPQGEMVLVPREPTEAMRAAWVSVNHEFDAVSGRYTFIGDSGNWLACYRAMLSAAPSRPVVDEVVVRSVITSLREHAGTMTSVWADALTAAIGQQGDGNGK